jgi:hypothetical protein
MRLHAALAALLALVSAQPFLKTYAAVQWQYIPGISGPGHAGMVVGDFDGNNVTELAVTAYGQESFSFNPDQMLVVHRPVNGPGTEIRRTHASLWEEQFTVRIMLLPRPGAADALIAVVQSLSGLDTLWILSGIPLSIEREFSVPTGFRPTLVADVDGNGSREILGLVHETYSGPGVALTAIDLTTGALEWSRPIIANSIAALQLDADPALEIVLTGTPGRVVDGATGLVEIDYPAGFGPLIAVGNFDLDLQSQEFVTGGDSSNPKLFRGTPFSLIGEVPASSVTGILARDINSDGITDLVVSRNTGPVQVFDPVTGTVLVSFPAAGLGGYALAAGNIDGLPGDEVAISNGLGSTEPDSLFIGSTTGQTLHHSVDEGGPYSTALLADIESDGDEEALFVVSTNMADYIGPSLVVLDAANGDFLHTARMSSSFSLSFNSVSALIADQLDADHQLEIGIGLQHGGFSPGMILMDGELLQPQWGQNTSYRTVDAVVADLTGLGPRKIVAATGDARLAVIDSLTGANEWRSVALAQFGTATALTVANIDTDPAAEMIISIGSATYAFDGVTRFLEWSMSTGSPINGLQVWGSGADCRIAGWVGLAMVIYRCSDRSIVNSISLPANSVYGRVINTDQGLVAVACNGRLEIIKPDGGTIYSSPYLGAALGTGNRGVIREVETGRRYEALMGTNARVLRFDFDLDLLHVDGFE